MVFSNYWKEKDEYDAKKKTQLTTPAPAQSPLFNNSVLFKNIEDRDTMSDTDLRYFIQNNFPAIMNNVFNKDIGAKYIVAFQDARFIDAFIDVIYRMQFFDADVIVKINLLVYHYITSSVKKPELIHRMIRLGSIVNRTKLIALKKFNMPENLENYLLIARYSDFDLSVCVKRVNLMIVTSQQILSLLNIDDDFEATDSAIEWLANLLIELYQRNEWNFVLPYFMLDVLPDVDELNPNSQWVTPEVEVIDSAMSLAVLKILDTMIDDSNTLRSILISYAEGYRIMNNGKRVRFSFQSISDDYPRLRAAIKFLELNEGIYVP